MFKVETYRHVYRAEQKEPTQFGSVSGSEIQNLCIGRNLGYVSFWLISLCVNMMQLAWSWPDGRTRASNRREAVTPSLRVWRTTRKPFRFLQRKGTSHIFTSRPRADLNIEWQDTKFFYIIFTTSPNLTSPSVCHRYRISHKQRSSPLATPLQSPPLSLPLSSSSVQFFYSTSAQAGLQESRRIAGGREGEE